DEGRGGGVYRVDSRQSTVKLRDKWPEPSTLNSQHSTLLKDGEGDAVRPRRALDPCVPAAGDGCGAAVTGAGNEAVLEDAKSEPFDERQPAARAPRVLPFPGASGEVPRVDVVEAFFRADL